MLFSLLKHFLDTDTALKVSQSVYYFTASISHGVENCFPRLWGTGISDAIFFKNYVLVNLSLPQAFRVTLDLAINYEVSRILTLVCRGHINVI